MQTRNLRAVTGLVVLAALLRLPTLGHQSFWLDEAVTVDLLQRPLSGMLAALPTSESTPPLYYILGWGWARVFGSAEFGLRLLSALAGIATVPVARAAAARLVSPRAGLIVATLAAVNPLLVWYSQEARAYALLALLAAASLAAFAALLDGEGSLALWALSSALALATHYFAVFVVVPEAVWLLVLWRRPSPRQSLAIGAVVAAGAALLPLALTQRSNDSTAFIVKSGLERRLLQLPKQDLIGFYFPGQAAAAAVAVLGAAVGLWILRARADPSEREGARRSALIAAPAIALPLLLAVAGADYFITRNLLATWLPLATVLAAGLGARAAGRAGLGATAALVTVSLLAIAAIETHAADQRDDWRSISRALGPASVDRAIVIQPLGGRRALAVYQPGLHPFPHTAAPVGEIDAVAVILRAGSHRPPHPPSAAPPAGFQIVERRVAETYTLIRMRAERPVAVEPIPPLAALRFTTDPADFTFQRAR
ncbi:MAG: hypothetical protein NVS2B9_05960 [Myxococcales bacterium]